VSSAIDVGASARAFASGLEDPRIALAADMAHASRTLLLAFGGIVGRIGIPPFEFFALTAGMPVKRLFVRDLHQAWYHRGIPGHGSTLPQTAESLRDLLAREQVDRLVLAGNSAGGYAALVFGALLGADTVLCFAPQTVLELDSLAAMNDHRWDDRLSEHEATGAIDARFTDVRRLLSSTQLTDTDFRVYFDASLQADRLHAERLADLRGVRLYGFGHGGHGIARALRDCGALQRVVRRALDAPGERHSNAKFGHSPASISG
jgi:pimeloyl-ACP methyl ester carboxylesterase